MNWPWDAHVGQEIVCVRDDAMWNVELLMRMKPPLTRGRIYIIVAIELFNNKPFFSLDFKPEDIFDWHCFRPLDKSKTQDTIDRLKELEDELV